MAKEKYHNIDNETREKEAREYIEAQKPVVAEEVPILNPGGGNVPEPAPAAKKVSK